MSNNYIENTIDCCLGLQVKKEAAQNGAGPSGTGGAAPQKAVRVKKEYDTPGQTMDTPDEIDPLRKFYTSLIKQRPDSEMAKKWCAAAVDTFNNATLFRLKLPN